MVLEPTAEARQPAQTVVEVSVAWHLVVRVVSLTSTRLVRPVVEVVLATLVGVEVVRPQVPTTRPVVVEVVAQATQPVA